MSSPQENLCRHCWLLLCRPAASPYSDHRARREPGAKETPKESLISLLVNDCLK